MSEDIKKKKSLGRGLEALLGEMNEDVLNDELKQVKLGDVASVNDIYVSSFQPRKYFDENCIYQDWIDFLRVKDWRSIKGVADCFFNSNLWYVE